MQSQMNTPCDITTEVIMSANYRGLQLLAKRVGIRANTRENVLRQALLRVSVSEATLLQESVEPCAEGNFQSSCPTALSLNTILIAMVSLFFVLRFPNCFTFFSFESNNSWSAATHGSQTQTAAHSIDPVIFLRCQRKTPASTCLAGV